MQHKLIHIHTPKIKLMTSANNSPKNTNTTDKPDDHDVIYALRTAQQHQVQLSLIADQKANIIIGVTMIFLSAIQSQLFSSDFSSKVYFLPLIVLSVMISIAFFTAILVVLPRTSNQKFKTPEEMPNPLFFGHYASLDEKTYSNYMLNILKDNTSARELLIKDTYQIGRILKKKYALLKYSYMFLASGVLIFVLALAINFIA